MKKYFNKVFLDDFIFLLSVPSSSFFVYLNLVQIIVYSINVCLKDIVTLTLHFE